MNNPGYIDRRAMAYLKQDDFNPKYRYGHDSLAVVQEILRRKTAAG